MIDLHCHSNFSDGRYTPLVILNKALAKGLHLIALTDHDTVAGLAELRAAAQGSPIKIINGIEFSACWKKYDIHILGLNIDPNEPGLNLLLEQQNANRKLRAQQIGERLMDCGVVEAYAKSCEIAGHERVARPHFAQILVNEGKAPDIQTAFKRFLKKGKSAYVPTQWLTMETVIAGISQAKGQAVLAHPLKYSLTRTKLHELITEFKQAGGLGIEVVSGAMTKPQINEMAALAQRFQLLASSGSDYHGEGLSRVSLGEQHQLPVNCSPIWHQWN